MVESLGNSADELAPVSDARDETLVALVFENVVDHLFLGEDLAATFIGAFKLERLTVLNVLQIPVLTHQWFVWAIFAFELYRL